MLTERSSLGRCDLNELCLEKGAFFSAPWPWSPIDIYVDNLDDCSSFQEQVLNSSLRAHFDGPGAITRSKASNDVNATNKKGIEDSG